MTVALQPRKIIGSFGNIGSQNLCAHVIIFFSFTALLGDLAKTITTDSAAEWRGNIQWVVFALAYQFLLQHLDCPNHQSTIL